MGTGTNGDDRAGSEASIEVVSVLPVQTTMSGGWTGDEGPPTEKAAKKGVSFGEESASSAQDNATYVVPPRLPGS